MPEEACLDPSVVFASVTAGYGDRRVLDDWSLDLRGAGITHLAGPNGSGKSTVVELMSGYLPPWAGAVRVCGQAASSRQARHHRGVCRSRPALYADMTVREHLWFTARTRPHKDSEQLERLLARARTFGLEPWLHTPADQLSNGNKRKLWLLMTTAGRPCVLILDEPFEGLDEQGVSVLLAEIQAWARRKLVIVVAHQEPTGFTADRRLDLPSVEKTPEPGASPSE
ncbi:MAG: ATP-binding cassette domain-containing protein, partial [Propionibacteriaceae bacterium]|nr:ATP-binding cassette domain-containing protein [Propionibacteriaceae bacterium]